MSPLLFISHVVYPYKHQHAKFTLVQLSALGSRSLNSTFNWTNKSDSKLPLPALILKEAEGCVLSNCVFMAKPAISMANCLLGFQYVCHPITYKWRKKLRKLQSFSLNSPSCFHLHFFLCLSFLDQITFETELRGLFKVSLQYTDVKISSRHIENKSWLWNHLLNGYHISGINTVTSLG